MQTVVRIVASTEDYVGRRTVGDRRRQWYGRAIIDHEGVDLIANYGWQLQERERALTRISLHLHVRQKVFQVCFGIDCSYCSWNHVRGLH